MTATLGFFLTLLASMGLALFHFLQRLPYIQIPAIIIFGFVFSEAFVFTFEETGFRADTFQTITNNIALPILAIYSGSLVHKRYLKSHLLRFSIATLICGVSFASITAYYLFKSIGYPSHFPFTAALLAATILLVFEPILSNSKKVSKVENLNELSCISSELLALIAFPTLLYLSNEQLNSLPPYTLITTITLSLAIASVSSWIFGHLLVKQLHINPSSHLTQALFIVILFVNFVLESILDGSGTVMLFITAIIASDELKKIKLLPNLHKTIYLVLLMLLGVSTTIEMFEERWLAMLMAVGAYLGAKFVYTFVYFSFFKRSISKRKMIRPFLLMYTGTQVGSLGLALVFIIPTSLESWWTIQSMVFGVILFNFLILQPLNYKIANTA